MYINTAEKPMKVIKENNPNSTLRTPLYRHVFYGRFSTVVVLLLLTSILLQPIDRAHASDADTPTTSPPIDTTTAIAEDGSPPEVAPVLVDTAKESVTTPVVEIVPESAMASDFVVTATTTEQAVVGEVATTTESLEPVPKGGGSSDLATEPSTDTAITPDVTPDTTDTANTPSSVPTEELLTDTPALATTTPDSASSTASSTGSTFTVTTLPTSDSAIQFDKNDCVAVADGSYYCHTKQIATSSQITDGLYSQPDVDGDMEIFFAKNGNLEQISHNTVDDASPFYDSISNTIVWHRLLDDRYQIISYDVSSGAESQLTTDNVNNMEPNRAGKYTVWQHWNKDNWDIMLYDGSTIKLLTDTPQHDIAPVIRGNLVMWNRLTSDKQQTIELYDLNSGEYTTINDSEGGALSNPRMVLVYDAQFENGDVVTKGYDVATGKITPLSSVPADLPDKIPPPDKTGETRALIQSKSTSREDSEPIATPKPTIDPPVPGTSSTTVTSSDSSTINMQQTVATSTTAVASTTLDFTLDLSTSTSLQLTDADVVVPSFSLASTTE